MKTFSHFFKFWENLDLNFNVNLIRFKNNTFTNNLLAGLVLSICTILSCISCTDTPPPPPPKDFSKLSWLLGTWKVNQGTYYERWLELNDSTYFGRSFKIYNEADTFMMETIDLVIRQGEIYYIPTVKTQNGNKPVTFNMTSDSPDYFIFENPKHDFPKKITYTPIDKNTAQAIIEDGKRKVEYAFERLD